MVVKPESKGVLRDSMAADAFTMSRELYRLERALLDWRDADALACAERIAALAESVRDAARSLESFK